MLSWKFKWIHFVSFLTLGGDAGAGWRSQLWAEPKAEGTRSTNPTETEKGEQEEEIENMCVWECEQWRCSRECVCLTNFLIMDSLTALKDVVWTRHCSAFRSSVFFVFCHVFQNSDFMSLYVRIIVFVVIFGVIFLCQF